MMLYPPEEHLVDDPQTRVHGRTVRYWDRRGRSGRLRARCPVCGRMRVLKGDVLPEHRYPMSPVKVGRAVVQAERYVCRGGGLSAGLPGGVTLEPGELHDLFPEVKDPWCEGCRDVGCEYCYDDRRHPIVCLCKQAGQPRGEIAARLVGSLSDAARRGETTCWKS